MPNVRALLTRVAKLEAARVAPRSPIEVAFGSMEAFADRVNADIGAGRLDGIDMPMVLAAVARWHRDRVWDGWTRFANGRLDQR